MVRAHAPNIIVSEYTIHTLTKEQFEKQDDSLSEDPRSWKKHNVSLQSIMAFRKSLVGVRSKDLPTVQELALAQTTPLVDVEKQIGTSLATPKDMLPFQKGDYSHIHILENTPLRELENAYYDTDATVSQALESLENVSEYHISRLFSVAGLGKNRQIVPTRQAITAVDSLKSAQLKKELAGCDTHANMIFFDEYEKNAFTIILLEGPFCFEFIEVIGQKICLNREKEFGKSGYATETAGAYYSAKLAVLEYLRLVKKQASVVIFRSIDPSYKSAGVWVVRETVRDALLKQGLEFSDVALVKKYLQLKKLPIEKSQFLSQQQRMLI
ncbi:MAG: hypothetical protein ACMXYF_06050 [Candidatus Woesearchaeota archaeon]